MRPVYLLDTCTVSEVAKPLPSEKVMMELEAKTALCVISTITWSELQYGYHLLPEGRKKTAICSFLYEYVQPSFTQIAFDEHAASIMADLRFRLRSRGYQIDIQDIMIASIAIANNLILVTRNSRHFEPLKEVSTLMIDDWWE